MDETTFVNQIQNFTEKKCASNEIPFSWKMKTEKKFYAETMTFTLFSTNFRLNLLIRSYFVLCMNLHTVCFRKELSNV